MRWIIDSISAKAPQRQPGEQSIDMVAKRWSPGRRKMAAGVRRRYRQDAKQSVCGGKTELF